MIGGLALMGFGGGFFEACLTSVISHFEDSGFMNILYSFFGLGALVSPFVIGALAKAGTSWTMYYWFPFSLAMLVTVCHFLLFKHYAAPSGEGSAEHRSVRARFTRMTRMKIVWLGSILIIPNLAIAVVDFLSYRRQRLWVRRFSLPIIYVLGRMIFSLPLIHVRDRMGNTLLLVSLCGAIAVLWTVNSSASDWTTIGVAGFCLGPIILSILSIVASRAPPSLKEIVVSITIGMGLVGSTIGPLIFGVAAEKVGYGLRVLPPMIIVLASLSALMFWAIPSREKRD